MSGRDENRKHRPPRRNDHIPALEWAAAGIGALLLAGALGLLVRQAFIADPTPRSVALEVKAVRALDAGFLVQFEAHNTGSRTYAELEIEGTLRDRSGRTERATATLDYLPGGSSREAGLFFGSDPALGELHLAPKGFRAP